jgi:hypothetical protein
MVMETVTVKINPKTRRGKYLIGLLKDMAKYGNDVEFDEIPNSETSRAIEDARAGKVFKAKDVKDLFKQLEI